jgi:hypothetical protein
MDIGSILMGVALLLVVAFVVVRPLLDRAGIAEREPGPEDALLFERERVLTALRDLDFDHSMGKTVEEDYLTQRAQLLAQGADILEQLDRLGVAAPKVGAKTGVDDEIEQAVARLRGRTLVQNAEAEIEASIAARRAAARPAGRFCSQCGRPAQPGDKFCGACGASLATEGQPANAPR